MAKLTEQQMYYYAQVAFLPMILLLSFTLFQYLFLMYFNRRKEPRGMLLLVIAALGFAVLVPLAHPKEEVVHHLNDISEACSTLTFLLQITIIGRESNKKVKIKSLYFLTLAAELLIAAEIAVILLDLVEVFDPNAAKSVSKEVNQAIEDVSLIFIFMFRFYYLGLIKGFKSLLKTKKKEIFVYFLFLTHEYPFIALGEATDVSWEFVQGVYHRLLIVWCIGLTVKDKLKHGGFGSLTTTKLSQHASQHTSQSSQGRRRREFGPVGPDLKAAVAARGPSILHASAAVAPDQQQQSSTAILRK